MMADVDAGQTDLLRIRLGFWVVVLGLGVLLAVAAASIARWEAAADVAMVVGSVSGVIGTIVGAFFGVQVGSAGRERAEAERRRAEERALRLAAELPPQEARRILGV
jgi:hypothetical protein